MERGNPRGGELGYLELLEEENRRGVSLKGVEEFEGAIHEADGAVVAAEDDPAPPARAAHDLPRDLRRDHRRRRRRRR